MSSQAFKKSGKIDCPAISVEQKVLTVVDTGIGRLRILCRHPPEGILNNDRVLYLLRTTFVINTVQLVKYGFLGLVTNADLFQINIL